MKYWMEILGVDGVIAQQKGYTRKESAVRAAKTIGKVRSFIWIRIMQEDQGGPEGKEVFRLDEWEHTFEVGSRWVQRNGKIRTVARHAAGFWEEGVPDKATMPNRNVVLEPHPDLPDDKNYRHIDGTLHGDSEDGKLKTNHPLDLIKRIYS